MRNSVGVVLFVAMTTFILLLEGISTLSLPTEELPEETYTTTTFQSAKLLIAPEGNIRVLEEPSEELLESTQPLVNSLLDEDESFFKDESTYGSNFSSTTITSVIPTKVPGQEEQELTTLEVETISTLVPVEITTMSFESEAKPTTILPLAPTTTVEASSTNTMMTYPSKIESRTEDTKLLYSMSSETTTTRPTSHKEPPSSLPPKNSGKKDFKDPLLYSYQNDPHWEDISLLDFPDYQEEMSASKEEDKSKLNKIRLMDEEGVKDSMKIVLTPINYVRDARVHIKYKRISKDPTVDGSLLESPKRVPDMIQGISFPLLNQENVRILGDLPEGWYLVCAEVTKFNKMLEEKCFNTRIFEKASGGLEAGIIVLIVLAFVILTLLAGFIVYNKLQSSRRKKKDKEMQERIEKMAQKERELNERNKPAFHHIYVDPDEPYEERCIM